MTDYYQRNLPHYQPAFGTFFTTFRLVGSLPKSVVTRLKQEYQIQEEDQGKPEAQNIRKRYFKKFDQLLDRAEDGNHWLEISEVAQVVADKMHDLDNLKYELICYCIMPNHVHLLVEFKAKSERDESTYKSKRDESRSTTKPFPLTDVLKLIKGSTAREANKMLRRTGQFWQHESYDHLVRDNAEKERIIRYILLNPVKAGLVSHWEDWTWTYCKKEYLPIR